MVGTRGLYTFSGMYSHTHVVILGILIPQNRDNERMACVAKMKVSSDWLTQVAFSPWSVVEPGRCESLGARWISCLGLFVGFSGEARLAYGTSTGGVCLVTVTQSLDSLPSKSAYGPTFTVKTRMEHQVQQLFNRDKRYSTALTWVASNDNLILVTCKSGTVSLWSPGSCSPLQPV